MAPQQAKEKRIFKKKKKKERKKEKDPFDNVTKLFKMCFQFHFVQFHMLRLVSALSRTFSQQFRMQVDNGGKEVVG